MCQNKFLYNVQHKEPKKFEKSCKNLKLIRDNRAKYIKLMSQISNQIHHSSSECSAQRQVLHCKQINLGCSSAGGRSSTTNSETKAAVLLGI